MKKWLKVLIPLAVGLVITVIMMYSGGLFYADNAKDALRIACDSFFAPGALLFFYGGLRWTYNGGVMDGLGYSAKLVINRMRPHYEEHRQSFAEYRAKRESKAQPASPLVISGLIMVFVPSISTFYISQKMSNGMIKLVGDLIETKIKEQWSTGGLNVGAAMSFVLMVVILICTFVMNRFSDSEGGDVVI